MENTVAGMAQLLACPFGHYYWDPAFKAVGGNEFVVRPCIQAAATSTEVEPFEQRDKALDIESNFAS